MLGALASLRFLREERLPRCAPRSPTELGRRAGNGDRHVIAAAKRSSRLFEDASRVVAYP
jgi:hypothetical protein